MKVKTYCYGKLREFNFKDDALEFYFQAIMQCEGSEKDRYVQIYTKLISNDKPFCDCDGVPAKRKMKTQMTEKESEEAYALVKKRRNIVSVLDALRAKRDLLWQDLEAKFKKDNEQLLDEIEKYSIDFHILTEQILAYEKRGFKV